jgi:hypothetical protein
MNGKVRFAVLVAVTAATVVIGALFALKSEAGGSKPVANIALVASFRALVTDPQPSDRILGDGKGPYVHEEASAGPVSVHLVSPHWQNGGNFFMYLDNGGDQTLGRTVGFLFDQWAYSCTIDSRKDSTLYKDFEVGPGSALVKSRWVQFKTWYAYKRDPATGRYFESLEVLNFTTMGVNGNPKKAYVGFSINFGVTLEGGVTSDEYYMGFRWDPVEVEALIIGPNGPTQWAIRPIQDPNVYTNIYQKIDDGSYKPYVPARMLLQIHYPTGGKRNVGYQSQCYGLYWMPFELHLTRMQ